MWRFGPALVRLGLVGRTQLVPVRSGRARCAPVGPGEARWDPAGPPTALVRRRGLSSAAMAAMTCRRLPQTAGAALRFESDRRGSYSPAPSPRIEFTNSQDLSIMP